ncbi:response regulator [Colwellia sp. BRX8-7]|uniref:ATP-binding response regulator n=1 Tax=unclassified Colwellia TaxID=196834 RepID=UPI0015F611EC|nr:MULTISPECIES: HAMP domain-containing sensor histidine kinase [unclassified Colwellia]MBA6336070.1 response regulator [Colwellia sp. BRX8-7]MBA6350086.1 response regulator [Colwellia sp. BRX8-9]MBA6371405.1 response regulator [Colwellia sp. BRX8-4]
MQLVKDEHIQDKIHAEQIKIMHSSIPLILFTNFVVVLALSYGFSDVVSQTSLKICLGLMFVMVAVRAGLYFNYKDKFDSKDLRPLALSLIIGSGLAGVLWATLSLLYLPADNQIYQIFLLGGLMVMAGGSAFTFSIYLPCYFAYIPATLLPITLQFFIIGDKFHNTLGIISVTYFLVLTLFNIKINKHFKATLALRFENLFLIEQLKEQKEEAERANKAKSKFLAAASHDLRQPLYALGLFTSVLDETIKFPKVKRVVEQINSSVTALTNLFDKLLDISQLDAGVVIVNKQDFALSDIFDKLTKEFSREAQENNIEFIWPTEYPAVHSEPDLLERILRNYLSNAIKYTCEGCVEVICEARNGKVYIRISDTGIGMTEETLEEIYEEFYQVSNPERDRQKGLGLGLSIIKRTADLLNHEISVTSEIGKGSIFSIVVTQAVMMSKANSEVSNICEQIQPTNKLVLVIDDEESIREGLTCMLELWGYQVIAAVDTTVAIHQLQENNQSPDVIISDYRLKENRTGIDAIKALHEKYGKDIPALLITGDMMQERLIEIKDSGLLVLFKPVPAMKLRSFLSSIK